MVRSKKECSKKTSEMIWKMPEKNLIRKCPKGTRKNIMMSNLLTNMHE